MKRSRGYEHEDLKDVAKIHDSSLQHLDRDHLKMISCQLPSRIKDKMKERFSSLVRSVTDLRSFGH